MKITSVLFACLVVAGCSDEQNLGFSGPAPSATSPTATGSTKLWAVMLDPGVANGVVMDSTGDVIAVGQNTSTNDAFVTKRAAFDGSERWTTTFAGGISEVDGVGIDSEDSLIVAGQTQGVVDLGGQTLTSSSTGGDAFIAKYTRDGVIVWAHALGSIGATARAIVVAPDGRATIAGSFVGTLQLGGDTYTGPGTFLATYDWTGTLLWATAFGNGTTILAMTLASNGDVIAAGNLTEAASVGGAVLAAGVNARGFVTRFDATGVYVSSSTIGDNSMSSYVDQVAITDDGDVLVEDRESDTGSDDVPEVHALDSDDDDMWQTIVPSIDNDPKFYALLSTRSTAQWVAQLDGTGALAITSYASDGTPTTATLGSQTVAGQTSIRTGATGALGVAALAGQIGGTIDFGAGPLVANPTTPSVLIVHVETP